MFSPFARPLPRGLALSRALGFACTLGRVGASRFDPLTPEQRRELLERPRPRRALPLLGEPPRNAASAPPLEAAPRDVDQRVRPIDAVWEITLACDLACRHCGSRAGKARADELDTREALDLVDQLAELGVMEVILIGGEAYLRPDWLDIMARIRERGMQPLMATGGRSFTAEMARDAHAAGLQSASVSIDGLQATHDRLRGSEGSFAAGLATLRHLREAGVPVSMNTQINRLSMPELPELLELLVGEGAHSWQLQLTVAMGRAADEPDVLLQPYDLLSLFPLLGRLKDRCDEAGVVLWPGNNLGYFGPIEHKLRGGMPRGHMGACGAGILGIGIEADGTIKGCPSLSTDSWGAGNVREHRLVELWERASRLRHNRARGVESLWGYCAGCYYADVCLAGCTWTSEALLGKPGNNPMCHHRALEHAREGKRERLVQVAPAPGRSFDQGRFELVVEALPSPVAQRGEPGG